LLILMSPPALPPRPAEEPVRVAGKKQALPKMAPIAAPPREAAPAAATAPVTPAAPPAAAPPAAAGAKPKEGAQ
jgi:rod shape-determining protein MreC